MEKKMTRARRMTCSVSRIRVLISIYGRQGA
jgi:hypothetical protein